MLKCFYKKYFGIECPGCGMQRSTEALMEGNIEQSILLYPMLLPIAAMLLFLGLHIKYKFDKGPKILVFMFMANSLGMLVSFVIKLVS